MKTRILYTKIWQDSFFVSLSSAEKLAFIYYLTNDQVNIIHFYECPDRRVMFETGITAPVLQAFKIKLQANKKMYFCKDYVFLVNAIRYESYTGEKNEEAKKKTIQLLSSDVLAWYKDIIDRGIDRGIDTQPIPPINHKSEIIIQKSEKIRGIRREDLTDIVLQEVANKYGTTLSFVKSKLEDLDNYTKAHGKKYTDYKAALSGFVKKDAPQKNSSKVSLSNYQLLKTV